MGKKRTTRRSAAAEKSPGASGSNGAANGATNGGDAGRAIWSGTISFGLVTVPVHLFSALRSRGVSLRMLDEDGTPLARRWYCEKDGKYLDDDEIVRGYEVKEDKFVVVTDEELEALEPRKSRDIDLRRFVAREEIDPRYFEHGYLLAPANDSTKAYRLLAAVMEETDRVGIATFVMRDREYLVAIFAENGVLVAETLRFADELRTPKDVGLASTAKGSAKSKGPDAVTQKRFERAIGAHAAKKLTASELEDEGGDNLIALVERKRKSGKDTIELPEAARADEKGAEIIDLMEVLKKSLQGESGARRKKR